MKYEYLVGTLAKEPDHRPDAKSASTSDARATSNADAARTAGMRRCSSL